MKTVKRPAKPAKKPRQATKSARKDAKTFIVEHHANYSKVECRFDTLRLQMRMGIIERIANRFCFSPDAEKKVFRTPYGITLDFLILINDVRVGHMKVSRECLSIYALDQRYGAELPLQEIVTCINGTRDDLLANRKFYNVVAAMTNLIRFPEGKSMDKVDFLVNFINQNTNEIEPFLTLYSPAYKLKLIDDGAGEAKDD